METKTRTFLTCSLILQTRLLFRKRESEWERKRVKVSKREWERVKERESNSKVLPHSRVCANQPIKISNFCLFLKLADFNLNSSSFFFLTYFLLSLNFFLSLSIFLFLSHFHQNVIELWRTFLLPFFPNFCSSFQNIVTNHEIRNVREREEKREREERERGREKREWVPVMSTVSWWSPEIDWRLSEQRMSLSEEEKCVQVCSSLLHGEWNKITSIDDVVISRIE